VARVSPLTLAGLDLLLDLLLHRAGWSGQVPARQAAERSEEQIGRWPTWPNATSPS